MLLTFFIMNFDVTRLFELSYYVETYPQGDFLLGFVLLFFFILLIFNKSILSKFIPNNKYFRKSIKNKTGRFVALGTLGIISVLSRFAEVPMFSMRLWLYIILLLSLIFIVITFYKVRTDYKNRLDAVKREKRKQGKGV